MPRLITTYIIREMAIPFLLSAAFLSVTMLMGKIIKLVELFIVQDVGVKYIAWFIISFAPSFLIYTLPASLLVAVLIACTRLSSDSEITALKSSGISLFAVMKPVFFLASVVFFLDLLITMYLYPWGNLNLKKLFFEVAKSKAIAAIEEKTFYDRFKNVVLYVDHIPAGGGELRGIFISEKKDNQSRIVVAEKGVFVPRPQDFSIVLRLENGEIHENSPGEDIYHIARFSDYTLELALEEKTKEEQGRAKKELYAGELLEKIREAEKEGAPSASYSIALQKRFAMPAAVFVFALLGVPLGMQRVRQARATGFGLATGVLIVYYLLTRTLESFGQAGFINPVIAVWGTLFILGLAGVYIFSMALREKEIFIVAIFEKILTFFIDKITGITGSKK